MADHIEFAFLPEPISFTLEKNYPLPILQQERSAAVDVLRGFALGGVVLANLVSFPSFVMPAKVVERLSDTTGDRIYEYLFTVFVDHKFITLFSLLFGYGFGVIMERLSDKGINQALFFSRRMMLLLLIGVIHLLFWWGEILHTYAVVGLTMLLFRKSSDKTLLLTAGFMLIVPIVAIRYVQITYHPLVPPQSELVFTEYLTLSLQPTLSAVIKANTLNHHYIYIQCYYEAADFFEILGKFLFGYFVLRKGYLKDIPKHLNAIRKFLKWSIPIALLYVVEMTFFYFMEIKLKNTGARLILFDLNRFGVLMLSASYAGMLVVMIHTWPRATLFSAMRYVGMMSLTNYLTHTIFYVILLHGIGFGLMGKTHLLTTFFMGTGIYVLQVFISKYWLRYYQYGPVEWIWRQLSYWKRIPIQKEAIS